MATSSDKVRELVESVRKDRGKLGSILRPLMILPFVSGQVRELVNMPAEQLDPLLDQVIDFVSELRSDPIEDAA